MGFFSELDKKYAVTRSDITFALFVCLSALVGFVYVTFIEGTMPERDRRELLRLQLAFDSTSRAGKINSIPNAESKDLIKDSSRASSDSSSTDTATVPTAKAEEGLLASAGRSGSPQKFVLPPTGKVAQKDLIDLNKASRSELLRLPGVGEKTADAVIEYRKNNPFGSIEDIMLIKGIGEKKFEKMKPFIVVR